MIKPLLITLLETALNQYLALDDNASRFLTPLAGKVIGVTIEPFNETIYLCPDTDTIQILDAYPSAPDTQLTGTLMALGLMGFSANPMRTLFAGQVKIDGDVHTGQKLQDLFAKLDINFEAKLARYTGEQFAQNIAQLFRAGQAWSAETFETFQLNLSEFLQEETRELPPAAELDIYFQQVDKIRTDLDRLNSRIERLQTALLARQNTQNPDER
jgi:ubiquinone biosynthesis protein UbiJ